MAAHRCNDGNDGDDGHDRHDRHDDGALDVEDRRHGPPRAQAPLMAAMLAPFAIASAAGLSWFAMPETPPNPPAPSSTLLSPQALKHRVAIVTGGGTGIGLAIAKQLGALGATVVFGSRNSVHLEEGSAELRRAGCDALACQVDVRKPDQVDEMVHRAIRHYGQVDILINNAAGNFICRAEDLSPNGWNAVIGSVLNGSFYCSRAVGRHMIATGQGRRDRLGARRTTSGPAAPAPCIPPPPRRA